MNATERAALLHRSEIHDQVSMALDPRTHEVLERRRLRTVIRRRGWLVRRLLLAADVVGLVVAILTAEWALTRGSGTLDARAEVVVFLTTLPAWIVVAKLYGLYDGDEERADHSTADDLVGVFHMVTVCTWLLTVGSYLTGLARPTAGKLVVFWATATVLVTAGRAGARVVARRSLLYIQNAVVVGAGDVGQLIAKKILQHPEYGINVVGFIDDDPKERRDDLEHLALLGGVDRLTAVIRLFDIDRVIVAFSNETHEDTLALLASLKDLDVQIDIVPRLFETVGPRVGIHTIEGIPLVGLPPLKLSPSSLFLKRTLDVVGATTALIFLSPVFLAVAVGIWATTRGPALYLDERVGRRGKQFRAIKFRTMCSNADELLDALLDRDQHAREEFDRTHKLAFDPRVTRLGRLLRRTSLDELPQLINVVRGDLSLVGPRAITSYEFARYAAQPGAHGYWEFDLRPGVTGYWQVNGRSSLDYADRIRLDTQYVRSWSPGLDLRILALTIRALFGRKGAF